MATHIFLEFLHPACLGEMESNLTVAYFSNGLQKNHQLDFVSFLGDFFTDSTMVNHHFSPEIWEIFFWFSCSKHRVAWQVSKEGPRTWISSFEV